MNAVWFAIGVLSTFAGEITACIVYAVLANKKGGRK